MEHLFQQVQQVDVEEAVGLRDSRLVHGLKPGLGRQRRQLVPQAPDAEGLAVDAHGVAYKAPAFGC